MYSVKLYVNNNNMYLYDKLIDTSTVLTPSCNYIID